ncbi:hypothetical protein [Halosimplex halophilum]|uniref:hypothetical protein n=1 Tax=Halosimplex halophilum TaxID=2559572 RepID=UPI00107F3B4F|nr:hypothetical protein [Halosimplex halophilum]
MARFAKVSRGVSAPNDGADTTDHPEDPGSKCRACGHVGHAHEKVRVYTDGGPDGSYHYEYRCPGGDA